jgi:hypothetical protein
MENVVFERNLAAGGELARSGTMIEEFLAEHPDTRLLPGEDKDLEKEILKTVGEEWLYAKNPWLENKAPKDLIGTDREFRVRNLLRILVAADLS